MTAQHLAGVGGNPGQPNGILWFYAKKCFTICIFITKCDVTYTQRMFYKHRININMLFTDFSKTIIMFG